MCSFSGHRTLVVFSESTGKVTLASDGKGNKSETQIDFWGPVKVLAHIKESSLQITSHVKSCHLEMNVLGHVSLFCIIF